MKTWIKEIFFAGIMAMLLMSCEKEEERAIFKPAAVPVLSASANNLVLEQDKAGNSAVTFTWNPIDVGFNAAVRYSLQISKKGTNFAPASTTEINMSNATSSAFKVSDLNKELLKIVPAGLANDLEVRVKADLGTAAVEPIYSNVVALKATPYRDIINYSFPQALAIAGNFQGWDPAKAPKIVDKSATGTTGTNYEGYINFTDAKPEFKMVKGNNWSAGDFGSAGAGKLGNGGGNLMLTGGAGVYLLKANTQAMTWSATKITSWGVIGNATPGGWDNETRMTFNPATGSYSATLNLTVGEIKFRANNDWAINFGDNEGDNAPEYNGSNIKITTAGNYTVTLDLGVGGNYSYTVKKN